MEFLSLSGRFSVDVHTPFTIVLLLLVWLILPVVLQSCCTVTVRVRIITSTDVCRTLVAQDDEKIIASFHRESRFIINMVAERGACEWIADVHVPQVVKRTIEVPKMAEQILDVPVPEMVEQKLPESVSDDRIQQRTAEHIAVIPVPQDVKELVEVSEVFPQDRSQQCFLEQINETPDVSLAEKVFERPVTQTQQVVNTSVQHVFNTVEVEKHNQVTRHVEIPLLQIVKKTVEVPEVPPLQFTDKVIDKPVVAQRQISTVQTVQTSIEIPQLQYCDEVIDVPAVFVVLVPQVHVEIKTVEITQLQPVEQGSQVHVEMKTVEITQLQPVEKIGEIPEDFSVCIPRETLQQNKILCVVKKTLVKSRLEMLAEIECDEGHELMWQGNDSVSAAKDVWDEANEVSKKSPDCMVCTSASGSTRQQHKQRATTQTAQEEERGSEGRRVREGEKKKGGQVGKEQDREEREKGRKGQWRRDQEGRKKEEREAEEGGGELVEKDVTGWTEVTRNKRKKMVQMFVKVDGMKTVAMEVSPEDKVQKILNTVSGSDQDVYVTSGGRILRGSDKLKSFGVRDGSTVQVMSRMRGGGKHKDKKGKEEKKQVAQLDDGMCAMASEQMRQVMETLTTLADKSTGEDKRCVVDKVEEVRKAIVGLRKQARGEDLQRVAELEESLKRLEEEMLTWTVEEQEQRRQEEQRRQGEQEEQRRQKKRARAKAARRTRRAKAARRTRRATAARRARAKAARRARTCGDEKCGNERKNGGENDNGDKCEGGSQR